MTMIFGLMKHRPESAPAVEHAMRSLAALGHAPFVQTLVGDRILRATADGELSWITEHDARSTFREIEEHGQWVSIPNEVAGDYFTMLAALGLPWPTQGAWQQQFTERYHGGFKLTLPGTLFDGKSFLPIDKMRDDCGPLDDDDNEEVATLLTRAARLLVVAYDHHLLTSFG